MANNVAITPGSGATVATDEVTDATLGTVQVQYFKLMDGTNDGTNRAVVDASGNLKVTGAVTQSGAWTVQPGNTANTTAWLVTGTGGTFPATQSGTWTDRVVGNAGGAFDFASTQNVATPAQAILIGGEFNTTPTTITTGNASPLQMDSVGNLLVNVKATLTQPVSGEVASGSSDSGNPQKIGGQARTTNPTAVTDGQRVNAIFDKLGKQIVVGAVRDLKAVQATSIAVNTETTVVTAGAAGVLNDVYGVICSNTSATAVNVAFKDSTGGTTRFTLQVPAGDVRGFMLPVDSAIPQATAANNWTATVSSAVSSILVTMLYVKNT